MTREQFDRACTIDREIKNLSSILDDAKRSCGVLYLFTYHATLTDKNFPLPMNITDDILKVIERHKEQLEKEFETI